MKLLIVCQSIDANDPVLGFFVRWVEECAQSFERIEVIALSRGETALPQNVSVHSLGKERGLGRLVYIARFYYYLFVLHRSYDAVFVHMNPEYVVLAGWWWALTGRPVGLWYNHTVASFWLTVAQPFTRWVFHTSPLAPTARYENAVRMPAGIDTTIFRPQSNVLRVPKSLYFQGRVAASKRVHVILEAFKTLYEHGDATHLTIVGPEVSSYARELRNAHAELIRLGAVEFRGPVPNRETPQLFAAHEVSVNLTDSGNYDKTVLESLACGTPVLVSSEAFGDAPVEYVESPDAQTLVAAYRSRRTRGTDELVHYVDATHSLTALGRRIAEIYRV